MAAATPCERGEAVLTGRARALIAGRRARRRS
jgi:hypothetical protein